MGSQTAHTVWWPSPSTGLILAPVPTPASAQVVNTVGSQNTRSIIHRKSPGVDYCNSLLYIVHEATRALLLLGQKSLPARLHATTVFRCKLKNTPRLTYRQTDRSNFITHSLTSRPSSMTVGDCRWPLYCLSSPLLPILWHLLQLKASDYILWCKWTVKSKIGLAIKQPDSVQELEIIFAMMSR